MIKGGLSQLQTIVVRGRYARESGISPEEKRGKLFNTKRPTCEMRGNVCYVNCFPGCDYVYHFGCAIASYCLTRGYSSVSVEIEEPTEQECDYALHESFGSTVPNVPCVVVGKVDELDGLASASKWLGVGDFLWKPMDGADNRAILLGCRHTLWGDIAGRLVRLLARNGAELIVYIGKLGSLNPNDVPSECLATGNASLLPSGNSVAWSNIFDGIPSHCIVLGKHITVRSVLEETQEWFQVSRLLARFVDPEIGRMAEHAAAEKVGFSYLHLISDNVSSRVYQLDLSNERTRPAVRRRRNLYGLVAQHIAYTLIKCGYRNRG